MNKTFQEIFGPMNQAIRTLIYIGGGFAFLVVFVYQAQAHGDKIEKLEERLDSATKSIIDMHRRDMRRARKERRADRRATNRKIDGNTDRILRAIHKKL